MHAPPCLTLAARACLLCLTIASSAGAQGSGPSPEPSRQDPRPSPTPAPAAEAAAEEQAASAADQPETLPVWHERIVITATRTDRSAKDLPIHTTVLDRAEILAAPDTGLVDLAAQITSLNLYGGSGSLVADAREQSLNFRGVSGANVSHGLLLVDGLPLQDPYNATALWSKVPRGMVDRIEVVRGGGANIWGSLALSGVVNLITRAPTQRHIEATARVGTRSTLDLGASYSEIGRSWAGWVAGSFLDTHGYYDLREADRGEIDRPRTKQFESLSGRLTRTLRPSLSLRLGGLLYREKRGEGTTLQHADNDEVSFFGTVDLVADAQTSWHFTAFARRQSLEDDASVISADRSSEEPASNIQLPSFSGGLSALWSAEVGGRHALTAGTDLHYASIERDEDLEWLDGRYTQRYFVEGKQQLAGLFVQDTFRLSSRSTLQLGARLDGIRTFGGRSVTADLLTGLVTEEADLMDNTEISFNPSLGFVHQASPSLRVRGSAYTGFRGPMPSELFIAVGSRPDRKTAPNPELKPESLVGVELGLDIDPSRTLSLRVTGFWSRIEDLIQRITLGRTGPDGGVIGPCGFVAPNGSCRQRQNIGGTQSAGVELEGELRPAPGWSIFLGATLLDAEITDFPANPELVGNMIEGTPDQRYSLGLHYSDPRGFHVMVRGRYVGTRFSDAENEEPLSDHVVVDLSASWHVTDRCELFAGIENALDETYSTGYQARGILIGAPRLINAGVRFRSRGGD